MTGKRPSTIYAEDQVIDSTSLGNREIIVTENRLIVTDEQGHGQPIINDLRSNITGFTYTKEYFHNHLYYSLGGLFAGVLCLLLVLAIIETGITGLLAEYGATADAPGADLLPLVFGTLLAGVSLFAWLSVFAAIACFIGCGYFFISFLRSGKAYLVIERPKDRPPYKIEADSKQDAVIAGNELRNIIYQN